MSLEQEEAHLNDGVPCMLWLYVVLATVPAQSEAAVEWVGNREANNECRAFQDLLY